MTFNPTKKRQAQWVKDHLNGGSFPPSKRDYCEEVQCTSDPYQQACYEAMEWLDQHDIETLAEAWDRCPAVEWLGWMYCFMEPTCQDAQQWLKLAREHDPDVTTSTWYSYVQEKLPRGDLALYIDVVDQCCAVLHFKNPDVIRASILNPWLPHGRKTK